MDLAVCCQTTTTADALSVLHPLQPLTPAEISQIAAIVNSDPPYGADTRFETMELCEPEKAVVRGFTPGSPIRRQARVNVFSAAKLGVTSLIVSLDTGKIVSRQEFPTARPMIQLEQFLADRRLRAQASGLHRRMCQARHHRHDDGLRRPMVGGQFRRSPARKAAICVTSSAWLRLRENENFYAHPIEGLNAVIDLKTWEVIRVDDYGVVPVPMQEANYEREFINTTRKPLKPIDVVQPQGVNFKVDGNSLSWDKWSLVVGFNARESLTLHDIRYDGRPILHRASLVEMVVPYGTPDNGHFRKNVFDIGEYGIGKLANSLKLGCDCLGAIEYLDVHLNTMHGDVMTIEKAICIHEEDSGLLWKHWDFRTDRTEVRRAPQARRLQHLHRRQLRIRDVLVLPHRRHDRIRNEGDRHHQYGGLHSRQAAEIRQGSAARRRRPYPPAHFLRAARYVRRWRRRTVSSSATRLPSRTARATRMATLSTRNRRCCAPSAQAARRANADSQRYWKVINPEQDQLCRLAGRLQTRRHQLREFLRQAEFAIGQARRLRPEPRLGDGLRSGAALRCRRVHEPVRRLRRPS